MITLNELIKFAEKENVDFDKPLYLDTEDGFFPFERCITDEELECIALVDGSC